MNSFRWATVTAVGPLRIKVDGDTSALPFTPDSLIDPASLAVNDRVWCDVANQPMKILGRSGGGVPSYTDWTALDTRMGDAEALAIANLNKIINGDFRINQRVAASGASLASGAYFLDRWRSGSASNAVTWTGDDIAGRVLTVPSGKVIQQIIERVNMPAGQYTVTHDGTAQVCMFNEGGSAPAKAAGPVTVTLDGSANVAVEFGTGTVSNVRVLPGTKAYPFIPRMISDELALCQRYYYRLTSVSTYQVLASGFQTSTTGATVFLALPVSLRTSPTVTKANLDYADIVGSNGAVSALTLSYAVAASVVLSVTMGSMGAITRPGVIRGSGTAGGYIGLDAEL